jgi:hypothetical protein
VLAVVALVGVTAGDQQAGPVEGHQPVQQQPAGAGGVGEEQHLPDAELARGRGLGEHHVARLHARGHRPAGDHVRGEPGRLWDERGGDQPGQAGEHQRRGQARDAEQAGRVPAEQRPPFHPGGHVFRASHVKFAVVAAFWALLLSTTE